MTRLCALYGVTPQGYYAWQRRPASAHTEQDRQLTQRIGTLYRAHGGRYGSVRIHRELRGQGCHVSLRLILARYVRYYNHWRLHSALGYRTPVDHEVEAA